MGTVSHPSDMNRGVRYRNNLTRNPDLVSQLLCLLCLILKANCSSLGPPGEWVGLEEDLDRDSGLSQNDRDSYFPFKLQVKRSEMEPSSLGLESEQDPCELHKRTLEELFHVVEDEVAHFKTCLSRTGQEV